MKIAKDVMHTQTKGCKICFHLGTTAFYIGNKRRDGKQGVYVRIFTPDKLFSIS
jgi:hypothetical protein